MTVQKVLFLCTGNSCRSQMAEAIVRAQLGNLWEATSAGTQPAGYIHLMAIQVLSEIGIDHRGHSKSVYSLGQQLFDLVVTVCDAAAQECPVWIGSGQRVHLAFADPATATGDEIEILDAFRRVRDAIADQVPALLSRYTAN